MLEILQFHLLLRRRRQHLLLLEDLLNSKCRLASSFCFLTIVFSFTFFFSLLLPRKGSEVVQEEWEPGAAGATEWGSRHNALILREPRSSSGRVCEDGGMAGLEMAHCDAVAAATLAALRPGLHRMRLLCSATIPSGAQSGQPLRLCHCSPVHEPANRVECLLYRDHT